MVTIFLDEVDKMDPKIADALAKIFRMQVVQRVATVLLASGLPMNRTNAFAALKEVTRDENVNIELLDECADDIIRTAQAVQRLLARGDIEPSSSGAERI